MKSRSTLVLTEIILMVLVFFVSAALCVNAFVKADALEKKSEIRDRALFEMQNVIETLKNSTDGVDMSPDSAVIMNFDGGDFYIKITFEESGYSDLWSAEITAFDAFDSPLSTLLAAGRIGGEASE